MTIQKIKSGRVPGISASQFVGEKGTIFYNETLGDLRLSDGHTLGGISINVGSGGGGSYTLSVITTDPGTESLSYNNNTGELTFTPAAPGTGTGHLVGDTSPTINSPTINDAVFQNTFSIGTQIFYTHTNGFSVNENFDITDPYGYNQSNFTGYHYTSGAGKDGVAFTLARTGNFTDGFGITGDAYNNQFVIGSETANTDYVFKTGIGMPFDVSGGTPIFTINRDGSLTFADETVQTTAWTGTVNELVSQDGSFTATLDNTGAFTIPGPLVFGTDSTRQITAYTGQSGGTDTIVSITVTMQLDESWQDTGISGQNLSSGTWLVQLFANDIGAGGHNINEYYSGVMSWYNGPTDSNQELPTDEIQLHRTGGSQDGGLYLRTLRSAHYTYLSLQIFSNTATHSTANYVFTFRKML